MPTVQPEQPDVSRQRAMAEYERSLLNLLRNGNYPEVDDRSEAQVLDLIRAGIVKARGYGIEICYDVTRFVEYTIQYGASFDTAAQTAWAGAILRLTNVSGTEKMNRIDAQEARRGREALA